MVTAHGLCRRFGDRLAVDGLSFDLRAGEIFALLGPNGAGKTTAIRLLAGLISPTSGSITVGGTELTARTAQVIRARVGILTEAPGLWERLTVRQNLTIYAELFEVPEVQATVERHLRLVELWERRDDQAGLLSKGMKQKLALARALVHDPQVVLLDEPTAGLDPRTARTVRELILNLRARRRAVLVSTHNLDEAERLADRVGVLRTRLVALDAPHALRRRLFGHRVRIRLDRDPTALVAQLAQAGATDIRTEGFGCVMDVSEPDIQIPAIVRALVSSGAGVREVADDRPSLEDIYLKLLEEAHPVNRREIERNPPPRTQRT